MHSLEVTVRSLIWQYVFDGSDGGSDDRWTLDETTCFAAEKELPAGTARFLGYWSDNSEHSIMDAIDHVTTDSGPVESSKVLEDDKSWLCIGGKPSKSYYLWNAEGYIIGMLQVSYVPRMVLDDGYALLKVAF